MRGFRDDNQECVPRSATKRKAAHALGVVNHAHDERHDGRCDEDEQDDVLEGLEEQSPEAAEGWLREHL